MGFGGQAGNSDGDGGVEEAFQGELAQDRVPYPCQVEFPPSLDSLVLHRWNITEIFEYLGQQWHDDRKEVITVMDDMQHNKWDILDHLD